MNESMDGRPHGASRHRLVRSVAGAVAALALLALGALGGVYWTRSRPTETTGTNVSSPAAAPSSAPSPARVSPETVEVTLTLEAIQRAGIKLEPVRTETVSSTMTVPATITSNAYNETKVNALVGGVVRQARAELGQSVRRGETLAVVFSHDLADAQMKYVSMLAMLVADHQKVERTGKLVAIGAASRQELDEVTAVHAAHESEVAAYRQRLLLLGLITTQVDNLREASQVVSEVFVPSPADGVVLARSVNPGQVVGPGHELFVVADLKTVWVIADVYEKDFGAVRVGAPASVVVPAQPSRTIHGRVAYIDPRVDPATRTAKVRVEIPKKEGELRIGMFVQVSFTASAGERRTVVPKIAVQSIGGRTVVYVATTDEARFVERTVKLGADSGDAVQVLDGVKAGESIVTDGSFFLRAEAARTRSGS
jgi:RND family efflux transporter MFP subunit